MRGARRISEVRIDGADRRGVENSGQPGDRDGPGDPHGLDGVDAADFGQRHVVGERPQFPAKACRHAASWDGTDDSDRLVAVGRDCC